MKLNFLSEISFSKRMILLFALILILVAIYYIYKLYNKKDIDTHIEEDNEGGIVELLFFHADWCPHCKTAMPEWENLKTNYENKMVNNFKINFIDIDCSNETDEITDLMNKYNVEGFPTFKLIKDDNVIEYDAKPNYDTLVEFLNTVI